MFRHLVYERPEDGTDVPKHVGAVKDYTDVCHMCIWLVSFLLSIFLSSDLNFSFLFLTNGISSSGDSLPKLNFA
jgi:hypothetical protein